jgi:hypothetical protein
VSPARGRAGEDAVQAFLRARGCAQHVVDGGVEHLVEAWERTARSTARGATDDEDEFKNDLDARQILADLLAEVPGAANGELVARIEAADELFRGAVELGTRCVWGAAVAKRERWTAKRNWWYFARPRGG